jgi:hypothetical protein
LLILTCNADDFRDHGRQLSSAVTIIGLSISRQIRRWYSVIHQWRSVIHQLYGLARFNSSTDDHQGLTPAVPPACYRQPAPGKALHGQP